MYQITKKRLRISNQTLTKHSRNPSKIGSEPKAGSLTTSVEDCLSNTLKIKPVSSMKESKVSGIVFVSFFMICLSMIILSCSSPMVEEMQPVPTVTQATQGDLKADISEFKFVGEIELYARIIGNQCGYKTDFGVVNVYQKTDQPSVIRFNAGSIPDWVIFKSATFQLLGNTSLINNEPVITFSPVWVTTQSYLAQLNEPNYDPFESVILDHYIPLRDMDRSNMTQRVENMLFVATNPSGAQYELMVERNEFQSLLDQ